MKLLLVYSSTKTMKYYESKVKKAVSKAVSKNEILEVYFIYRKHINTFVMLYPTLRIRNKTDNKFPVYVVCETKEEINDAHKTLDYVKDKISIIQAGFNETLIASDIVA